MKKSLLITTSLLTLGVVTGIYAQSVGATGSIVDKMKAVAHSFTLSTSLNPGDTGLTSDPVKGKKTGDILTAGEWNRVLELVSDGGGGGSGAGWIDVPLTDTADFDDSCMYRYQITYSSGGREPYVPKETYYYANGMSKTQLVWWLLNDSQNTTYHIASTSKNILRINGTPYITGGVSVTKIEKLCGGDGNAVSGIASRAAAVRASGHTLNIPSGITDWPDIIVCDGYGGWAGGTEVLTLDYTGNNVVGYTLSEGIGVYFNTSNGVLSQADRVGACGASGNNIASICAAGRCIYGSSASVGSSSWVDVPLTDTADFDVNCEYRVKGDWKSSNLTETSVDDWIYHPMRVGKKVIMWDNSLVIKSATKNVLWWSWSSNDTYTNVTAAWGRHITKIEKRCD